jgi:hypothetical protein
MFCSRLNSLFKSFQIITSLGAIAFGMLFYNFDFSKKNYLNNTIWEINYIKINNDTAFLKTDSTFTYRHNYNLNKSYLEETNDSLKVNKIANNKFRLTKTMKIEFKTNSTFVMTKMRSGGRIFPDEIDKGTYVLDSDTLMLTIRTRNNYPMKFILNKKEEKFYFYDESNGTNVYYEYVKIK